MKRSFAIPLRYLLMLISLLLTLAFIVVNSVQFSNIIQRFDRNEQDEMQQILFEQAVLTASEHLETLNDISNWLKNNDSLFVIARDYTSADSVDKMYMVSALRNIYSSINRQSRDHLHMALILENSVINLSILSLGINSLDHLYQKYPQIQDAPILVPAVDDREIYHLSAYTFFAVPLHWESLSACVILILPSTALQVDRSALIGNGQIFSNNTALLPEALSAPPSDVFVHTLDSFDTFSLIYHPEATAAADNNSITRTKLLIVTVLVALLMICCSVVFSNRIVSPIKKFTQQMTQLRLDSSSVPTALPPMNIRRRTFALFFSVVFVTGVLLGGGSYMLINDMITSAASRSLEDIARETKSEIDAYLNKIVESSIYLGYDTNIIRLLSNEDASIEQTEAPEWSENVVFEEEIYDALLSTWEKFEYKLDFTLYNLNGEVAYGTSVHQLLGHHPEEKNIRSWRVFDHNGTQLLQFQLILKDLNRYAPAGYLTCRFHAQQLEGLGANNAYSKMLIETETGRIFVSTQQHLIGSIYTPQKDDAAFQMPLEDTPFSLVLLPNTGYISEYADQYLSDSLYLLIIMLVVSALLSYLFAYMIERQFLHLLDVMNHTELLSEGTPLHLNSHITEIEQLGDTYSEMVERVRSLHENMIIVQRQQYQLELSRKQAQLTLLQLQIRPHFLYNTFENIIHLIHQHRGEQAASMLMKLSDMLRFVTRLEKHMISFGEELAYAHMYADIMLTRYPNSLNITFSIAPGLESLQVVKFFLQPLIENAIDHSIKPQGHGRIVVTAALMNEMLTVVIRDDGEGISPAALEKLQASLKQSELAVSVGLVNIHSRIRLHFGEPYGISISSAENVGTVVTVTMPAIAEKNHAI